MTSSVEGGGELVVGNRRAGRVDRAAYRPRQAVTERRLIVEDVAEDGSGDGM